MFLILLAMKPIAAVLVLTGPELGASFTASDGEIEIPIQWQDDGTEPTLSEISTYTFLLCTGPNDDIQCLQQIAPFSKDKLTTEAYVAIFDADLASDGKFYVQVYCVLENGGHVLRYTNRINLKGMTGSVVPSGTGSSPDGSVVDADSSEEAASASSASFTVPYTEQTGKTRYAPMQMQPGSTVTATTWSRRFPSSAVTYYSTISGTPNVMSTVTPGWSYVMSSFVNYATPAPFPSEVGWYPASAEIVSASLDSSLAKRKLKKRRWAD